MCWLLDPKNVSDENKYLQHKENSKSLWYFNFTQKVTIIHLSQSAFKGIAPRALLWCRCFQGSNLIILICYTFLNDTSVNCFFVELDERCPRSPSYLLSNSKTDFRIFNQSIELFQIESKRKFLTIFFLVLFLFPLLMESSQFPFSLLLTTLTLFQWWWYTTLSSYVVHDVSMNIVLQMHWLAEVGKFSVCVLFAWYMT